MNRKLWGWAWIACCAFLVCQPLPAPAYDSGVTVRVLLKSTEAGNGQPLEYLRTDRPEVTVAIVEIAPGTETGWHLHRIPVYAYVMEGTLKVLMEGGAERTFEKGQAVLEVQNVAHNGVNAGKDTVRLVVFYTGARDLPLAEKVTR